MNYEPYGNEKLTTKYNSCFVFFALAIISKKFKTHYYGAEDFSGYLYKKVDSKEYRER